MDLIKHKLKNDIDVEIEQYANIHYIKRVVIHSVRWSQYFMNDVPKGITNENHIPYISSGKKFYLCTHFNGHEAKE